MRMYVIYRASCETMAVQLDDATSFAILYNNKIVTTETTKDEQKMNCLIVCQLIYVDVLHYIYEKQHNLLPEQNLPFLYQQNIKYSITEQNYPKVNVKNHILLFDHIWKIIHIHNIVSELSEMMK